MIKYKLCPTQSPNFFDREGKFQAAKEYLENVFKFLEDRHLEERLYKVQHGQRIFIHSFMIDENREVCIFFRSTGDKTGHFTQRIEEPSGMYFHSNSLEFTYEWS